MSAVIFAFLTPSPIERKIENILIVVYNVSEEGPPKSEFL